MGKQPWKSYHKVDKVTQNGKDFCKIISIKLNFEFSELERILKSDSEPKISSSTSQEIKEILGRILQSQHLVHNVPSYYRVHPPMSMVQPMTSKSDVDIKNLLDMLK